MKTITKGAACLPILMLACGELESDPSSPTSSAALTPGVTWTVKSHQFFENEDAASSESGWDITTNLNGFRPHDVATDGVHMYTVGRNWIPRWRIEKRRLDTGAFEMVGTQRAEVIGDSGTKEAMAIALDAGHMYVVGTTVGGELRIEKRFLTGLMPMDLTFGTDGVESGTSGFEPLDLSIDDTFMYIAGRSGGLARIEKRRLSSGALVYGITSALFGASTYNGITIDDEFMYLAGATPVPLFSQNWRIEKRRLSDGGLESSFDGDGIVDGAALTQGYAAQALALAGDTLLVAGDRNHDFFIRHYHKETGALVRTVFGETLSDSPTSILVDGASYYVAGYDDSGDSRVERRALSTGALDTSFNGIGVITGNAVSVEARALAVGADSLFVVGVNNNAARLQRFFLSDGGTSSRTSLAYLGGALVGPDSRFDDHRTSPADFRLRIQIEASGADVDAGDDSFLLKVALKDEDACADVDPGDWDMLYPASGVIRMKDNPHAVHGARVRTGQSDPIAQTYNEMTTSFSTGQPMYDGERGVWDFALTHVGAAEGATYCLKVTNHDGDDIPHDVYPEVVPNPYPMLSATTLSCKSLKRTGRVPWNGTSTLFDRVDLSQTEYPDSICNDGSPAAMYIHIGSDHPDKWVFHMMGGGGCNDGQQCGDRWCGRADNFSARQMTTDDSPPHANPAGVLGNDPENPFRGWTEVLFKYCSSDSWSGQARGRQMVWTDTLATPTTTSSVTIQLLGHRVVEAMFDTLRHEYSQLVISQGGVDTVVPSIDNASEVVLTGSSGGGGGATRHLDWVHDTLTPHGTTVRGIFDASTHVDFSNPDLDWSTTTMCASPYAICDYDDSITWREGVFSVFREGFGDESCQATQPDPRLCTDNHYVQTNHITTPFLVREDQTDSLHLANFFGAGYTLSGPFAPGGVPTLMNNPGLAAQRQAYVALVEDGMRAFETLTLTAVEADSLTTDPAVWNPRCGFHDALLANERTWAREPGMSATMGDMWASWLGGGISAFFAPVGAAVGPCVYP